jgi:hypothetical protein
LKHAIAAAQYLVLMVHMVVHVPPEQKLPAPQVLPHMPQLLFVVSGASQPLETARSQSPKPVSQLAMPQTPAAHDGVAFAGAHTLPQSPQDEVVVFRSTSQPSAGLPLQSPKPALQRSTVQVPAVHAAVAFPTRQALPQPPQLPTLDPRFTSQPLEATPSQSAKPALQVKLQPPSAQRGLAFATAKHTVPQSPQLFVSVLRSAQTLVAAQKVVPAGQLDTQAPPAQRVPAAQTTPQPPQLVLELVLVSQPSATIALQFAKPGLQVPTVHRPAAQPATAFGTLHALPHAPQAVGVVLVFTSQPSAGLPLQSAKPASQAPTVQRPRVHAAVAWASMHALVHVPHAEAVPLRSVSQPLAAILSQSAKPASQVKPQALMAQVAVAWARAGQALSQAPQLATSFSVRAQMSDARQNVVPVGQLETHSPSEQRVPSAQARPQAPQLVFVLSCASQPLAAIMSQSPKPVSQVAVAQRPSMHAGVPRAVTQARPQAPQDITREPVSVSHPSATMSLQSPKPGMHMSMAQAPPMHAPTALAGLHARPQAPQWAAVALRFTSQPLAAIMSQSAKPAMHVPTAQAPATQFAVAFARAQAIPQPPQCATLVRVSTQAPMHAVPPSGQPASPVAPSPVAPSPAAVSSAASPPPSVTAPSAPVSPAAPSPWPRSPGASIVGTSSEVLSVPLSVALSAPVSPRGVTVVLPPSHPRPRVNTTALIRPVYRSITIPPSCVPPRS